MDDDAPLRAASAALPTAREHAADGSAQRRVTLAGTVLLVGSLFLLGTTHFVGSRGQGVAHQGDASGALDATSADGGERRLQMLVDDHEADSDGPPLMNFYVYRAQDEKEYPLENVNVADLPGVMWYLHNEVVGSVPRKFFIERILRYKVTMRPAEKLYDSRKKNFGPFVAFDSGRCTVPNCDGIWNSLGFNMGCQPLNTSRVAYFSPFMTRLGQKKPHMNDALWYSLPGPCPAMAYKQKDATCVAKMPGGQCNSPSELWQSGRACTYYAEKAGEITLNELSGIKDYFHWWSVEKNREYIWHEDKGRGADFWDGREDLEKCAERMRKIQQVFRRKYPNMPVTYGEPPCDS